MKLVKQKYHTASGEARINTYKLTISKHLLKAAGIKDTDDLEAKAEIGKIIIQKKDAYEEYLDKHYEEIYEEYYKRHPEHITSDFMLEEDGNEYYIEEIIKEK